MRGVLFSLRVLLSRTQHNGRVCCGDTLSSFYSGNIVDVSERRKEQVTNWYLKSGYGIKYFYLSYDL